jgi:NADPH2:quinone reductase
MSAEIKSMKALLLKTEEPSSPPSLITTTLPIPVPKPTYVLVKVHSAAINPSDVLNASGAFSHTTFPRVPGRDFAGIVAFGPPELQGRPVYGTSGNSLSFTEDGAHAEYCVVPSDAVAIMPKNFTFAQAASVGVPWTTAFIVLHRAQTIATETVLVLGATGAVGSAVVQLARAKGCKVITASRRQTTDINILTDQELSKAGTRSNWTDVQLKLKTRDL